MIKGKTSTGFEFEINENILNDMEILDLVTEISEDNMMALSPLINRIIGDQKKQLYDHVREKDGRVPVDKVSSEIVEIFNACGNAGKNS